MRTHKKYSIIRYKTLVYEKGTSTNIFSLSHTQFNTTYCTSNNMFLLWYCTWNSQVTISDRDNRIKINPGHKVVPEYYLPCQSGSADKQINKHTNKTGWRRLVQLKGMYRFLDSLMLSVQCTTSPPTGTILLGYFRIC